jgi:predicted lactoylglutathione lyase
MTGRPVCYHIIPDIRTPCFTGLEIMEAMKNVLHSQIQLSITADSFFASIGWLRANQTLPVTFGLSSLDLGRLTELFSHNLEQNQNRVFTDEKVVVSVWIDNKVVMAASTAFTAEQNTQHEKSLQHMGVDTSGLIPILSESSARNLASVLSTKELKALAQKCGCSTGTHSTK